MRPSCVTLELQHLLLDLSSVDICRLSSARLSEFRRFRRFRSGLGVLPGHLLDVDRAVQLPLQLISQGPKKDGKMGKNKRRKRRKRRMGRMRKKEKEKKKERS